MRSSSAFTGAASSAACDGSCTAKVPEHRPAYLVQEYAGKPNAVGGTGIAIVTIDYPLGPNGQGNGGTYGNWPVQWQAAKCALWTVVAKPDVFPGSRDVFGVYGDSAGAHLGWMMANTPDDAFPANCPVSPPAIEPRFKNVSAWPILSIMTPRGNAEWNCTKSQFRAPEISSLFGGECSPGAENECLAFSALHRPEPLQWITDENLATLQNVDQMFVFGREDELAMAFFDSEPTNCPGSKGGNLADAVAEYRSLASPIEPVVELVQDCGHICDLYDVTGGSVVDSYNFLTQ